MKYITFLLAIFSFGCHGVEPLKTGLEGDQLPSFDLLLPDSVTHFNTKNVPAGEPVVLFYFGPYCPYSRAQMADMIENAKILKNIRFYIFTNWPFANMKEFYDKYQLKQFANIMTGQDDNNFFGNYFGVKGVPYTAIYNKNKQLTNAFIGKIDSRQITQIANN